MISKLPKCESLCIDLSTAATNCLRVMLQYRLPTNLHKMEVVWMYICLFLLAVKFLYHELSSILLLAFAEVTDDFSSATSLDNDSTAKPSKSTLVAKEVNGEYHLLWWKFLSNPHESGIFR